jgi:hypothetical protein
VLLLREIDKRLGLLEAVDAVIPDPRDPRYIEHSQLSLLRQRIYELCLGYEDLNDHQTLSIDPTLQTSIEREEVLGSQSTLCHTLKPCFAVFCFDVDTVEQQHVEMHVQFERTAECWISITTPVCAFFRVNPAFLDQLGCISRLSDTPGRHEYFIPTPGIFGHEASILNKAAYLALGFNLLGKRELLGLWIAETEGLQFRVSVQGPETLQREGLFHCQCRQTQRITCGCQSRLPACAHPALHHPPAAQRFETGSRESRKAVAAALGSIYTAPSEVAGARCSARVYRTAEYQYPAIFHIRERDSIVCHAVLRLSTGHP